MNSNDDVTPDAGPGEGCNDEPGVRRDRNERGNVVWLPATTGDADVVEGELVPDADGEVERVPRLAFGTRRLIPREARRRMADGAVELSHRATPIAKTGGKAAIRHALYVPAGAAVLARRVWEAHTNSRYERMLRAAEAAGDWERLDDWEARAEHARERRHRRTMDWLSAPLQLVKALALGAASLVGVLLVLGILLALADKDPGLLLAPLAGFLDLVRWTAWVATVVWGPLVLSAPWLLVLTLWHIGRRSGASPAWLTPDKPEDDGGLLVTADAIAQALQHLGIPALNKAVKDGWLVAFEQMPHRDGQGIRAVFGLPMGVTPGMLADKRSVLARNLHRTEVEVWPSDYGKSPGGKAGYVDLWVADAGVLNRPAPAYPLLHEGSADVFAGVPLGVSQRGDVITVPLVGNDTVVGGQTGQGKSNIVRVLALGAALDALCELWVFVFAGNGDFTAYEPRLARFHKGANDDTVLAALEALRELYDETGRREQRLDELGAKKLTRRIAEQHVDMRPIFAGFSECHELFGHPDHGQDAADLTVATMRRARKTGISLCFDTQSSRADSIPPKIVELTKINLCLAVKTWRSNDGFLGDGSYASGVRATELRAGIDRGTCVATGVGEGAFEIVKSHFVEVDDDAGWDAATDVIARAMGQLKPGTRTAGDRPAPGGTDEQRDLLDDLDQVLDDQPVPAGDLPARLRELAPTWPAYQRMSRRHLLAALAEHGIKVPSTGNRYPVDPLAIRQALAARATADLDDDGGAARE